MTIKPNSSTLFPIMVLFDMQTGFFSNVLEGISEDDRHQRLDTKANHMAWLTGSMVQQRCELANLLGTQVQQSAHDLFAGNKGIKDDETYPTLASFKEDWQRVTPVFRETLMEVGDEKLQETFEMMPGMRMTHLDMVSFVVYREANIIGQLALWRRLLGYEAMKYM